jgi:queuine tRNA-ribosyltransferase
LEKSLFQVLAQDGPARTGILKTPHGLIKTPAFVPVATQGAVKALSGSHFSELGIQVLITNAYHLHLQPGEAVIQEMGGLHRFMGWSGPLMMDSGGYQVFSLGPAREKGGSKLAKPGVGKGELGTRRVSGEKPLVRVTEEGVTFTSYRDGSPHRFTPETVVTIAKTLGVDAMMVLDECTSPFHTYEETLAAMERTHRWALRSLEEFHRHPGNGTSLFGVVQGGSFQDLREESAAFIAGQPFEGYAIGGFLGTSSEERNRILQWTIPHFPPDRPRHFLGLGLVEDIFAMAAHGVDLFDCIAPTLMASTGTLLTRHYPRFRIRILNHRQKAESIPIEEGCGCYACRNHSRGYLRHLFLAKEPLGPMLATIHNLHFLEILMSEIRQVITKKQFEFFRKKWLGCVDNEKTPD